MSDATLTPAAEPHDPSNETVDGPACEKCGFAHDAAACPRCGWYPSLGIHVDIDQAFEAVTTAAKPMSHPATAQASEAAAPHWQKHLEVWRGLIPAWGWLMIGTTLGVVAAAIGVRVAAFTSPALQTWAGVGGLAVGVLATLLAHVVAFVLCSSDDADYGVTDLLIKPFKAWKRIAGELPDRLWLANGANASVTTALSAALIVGGIPYERVWDWGYKAPPKKSLVAAIAQQAAESGGGSDSLEGAIGDFAGNSAVKPGAATAAGAARPAEKPRQPLECLILGYQLNAEGELRRLLLAADRYGKLKYVGAVQPQLARDESERLLQRFATHPAPRPFVRSSEPGTWLQPRFACRVTYTDWPRGGRPKGLEWAALLNEVRTP